MQEEGQRLKADYATESLRPLLKQQWPSSSKNVNNFAQEAWKHYSKKEARLTTMREARDGLKAKIEDSRTQLDSIK